MPKYRLSLAAEQDIESILTWSDKHFGEAARLRYEALLVQAILDITEEADRPGSQRRPEIAVDARTYHLRYARDHVSKAIGRVKQPRHFLLYRIGRGGVVEIGRVLHDSMDLEQHLPLEYRRE